MSDLPLTDESFREVASRYATGVVVVTTQADGFDHAMTATSFSTVSLSPQLVLVCVEQNTRFHDALCGDDSAIGQAWGVSVLAADAAVTASWFATKGRPLHGQFDRYPHHRGAKTGNILFAGALATMEVLTTKFFPIGDHTIVIGEVQSLAVKEEMADALPESEDSWPLTYWARRYRNLAP